MKLRRYILWSLRIALWTFGLSLALMILRYFDRKLQEAIKTAELEENREAAEKAQEVR